MEISYSTPTLSLVLFLALGQLAHGAIGTVFSLWCLQYSMADYRRARRAGVQFGPEYMLALEPVLREIPVMLAQIVVVVLGAMGLANAEEVVVSPLRHQLTGAHLLLIVLSLCLLAQSVAGVSIRRWVHSQEQEMDQEPKTTEPQDAHT